MIFALAHHWCPANNIVINKVNTNLCSDSKEALPLLQSADDRHANARTKPQRAQAALGQPQRPQSVL